MQCHIVNKRLLHTAFSTNLPARLIICYKIFQFRRLLFYYFLFVQHTRFIFIRNICGGVEAEVPYFFKELEPHSSLLVPYFLSCFQCSLVFLRFYFLFQPGQFLKNSLFLELFLFTLEFLI